MKYQIGFNGWICKKSGIFKFGIVKFYSKLDTYLSIKIKDKFMPKYNRNG